MSDCKKEVLSWFNANQPVLPTRERFRGFVACTWIDDWWEETRVSRKEYNKLSWPILHQENLDSLTRFIKDHSPGKQILEVGCGTGWLAYWLRQYGLDVIGTDNKSWNRFHNYQESPIDIHRIGAVAALRRYSSDTVLMSWPPYRSTMPVRLLKELQPHQTLVFIGENNGCNGTRSFCDYLDLAVEIQYWDSFFAIHDSVYVLQNTNKRRETNVLHHQKFSEKA
jgi:SAM-dependent methyltransferase